MEAVIFIGIQATGKSTFYQERFANTHVRINLDTLKTRGRENMLVKSCIREGKSFVVDNTNVLEREREKYIALAKPAGYTIIGYFFQSRLPDALRRNRQRTGKDLIPDIGVRSKFKLLQHPRYAEGFDHIYYVSIGGNDQFIIQDWMED